MLAGGDGGPGLGLGLRRLRERPPEPLADLGGEGLERLETAVPDITVGLRSGDTSPADRRKLGTTPPDILITTPESLFLMLTSAARDTLRGVETVIVDLSLIHI